MSTQSANPTMKRYHCTFEGCNKSFSRPEHAHRHALNHSEGESTCIRCRAHFKRRDLLDRHMARHKEKDAEAGGEGLGRLATRKRLWRDDNGNIMARRRPEHEKPTRTTRKRQKPSCNTSESDDLERWAEEIQSLSNGSDISHELDQEIAPLSPPRSSSGSVSGPNNEIFPDMCLSTEEQWPTFDDLNAPQAPDHGDFLCNASWGLQPPGKPGQEIVFDDMFAPDTASSFNMPFTTISYYNWLFDSEVWTHRSVDIRRDEQSGISDSQTRESDAPRSTLSEQIPAADCVELSSDKEIVQENVSNPSIPSYNPRESTVDTGGIWRPSVPNNSHQTSNIHLSPSSNEDQGLSPVLFQDSANHSVYSALPASPCGKGSSNGEGCSKSTEISTLAFERQSFANHIDCHNSTTLSSIEQHHPSQLFNGKAQEAWPSEEDIKIREHLCVKRKRLPVVDETARSGVLRLVNRARPKTPDGAEISTEHPLLSLSALQSYSDLYFTCFNVSYPLLHQATFQPSCVDPLLLMAVLLLGATYSDKEAHLLAVCIHNVMRVEIMSSEAFSARPSLWILQTILLVECFGKSRAGQLQHDMSHLFHGMLINLIRRSDCQSAQSPIFDEEFHDLDYQWKSAVDAEQRRRLALLCFMWDTQHAVLFSQSLCMNASELKLSLPWDAAIWEAETAEEWFALQQINAPPPQFLSAFRSYVNPGTEPSNTHLNALSRVLILHGLMSVAWDLNRRDQTSLGLAVTNGEDTWRSRMMRSYEAWKSDFDVYCKVAMRGLTSDTEAKSRFQRFCISSFAIYHAASITLQVEIIDLQIYAGAKHIIGRPVTHADKERSRRRIEKWVKDDFASAAKAGSHAACLLRDGIRKLKDWDVDNVFHYPWCLYIATLSCWAFHAAGIGHNAGTSTLEAGAEIVEDGVAGVTEEDEDEDVDWDSQAQMNMMISAMTRSKIEDMRRSRGEYSATGLIQVMIKHLNTIRWALVREGMIVLQGLVQNKRRSRA